MGKCWSLGLFCFALLIAFDSAFAAQTEPITEKDKSRIRRSSASRPARAYPWKTNIVTTVFWIGEQPGGNNLVPNRTSAWDKQWTKSYGGFDDPNPAHRGNYVPTKFMPQQNPFYCSLPYNDKAHTGHRPEAPRVVPWFQEAYRGSAVSTCKDRWVAIRITGITRTKGKFMGQEFSTHERATDVFVKCDGRWQCVLTHLTRFIKK